MSLERVPSSLMLANILSQKTCIIRIRRFQKQQKVVITGKVSHIAITREPLQKIPCQLRPQGSGKPVQEGGTFCHSAFKAIKPATASTEISTPEFGLPQFMQIHQFFLYYQTLNEQKTVHGVMIEIIHTHRIKVENRQQLEIRFCRATGLITRRINYKSSSLKHTKCKLHACNSLTTFKMKSCKRKAIHFKASHML